jgi:hypothetical protein
MWGGGGGWRVLCALAVATLLQCVAATVVPNSMCIAVLRCDSLSAPPPRHRRRTRPPVRAGTQRYLGWSTRDPVV